MKNSRVLCKQIAKKRAGIESEIAALREKLRTLDAQRERLRITHSELLELQGKQKRKTRDPSTAEPDGKKRKFPGRFFRSVGQTAKLMRYLYVSDSGGTVVEAARRTGVSTRRTRTAFERLCASGHLVRSGDRYALTQTGIAAWQNSPLFEAERA